MTDPSDAQPSEPEAPSEDPAGRRADRRRSGASGAGGTAGGGRSRGAWEPRADEVDGARADGNAARRRTRATRGTAVAGARVPGRHSGQHRIVSPDPAVTPEPDGEPEAAPPERAAPVRRAGPRSAAAPRGEPAEAAPRGGADATVAHELDVAELLGEVGPAGDAAGSAAPVATPPTPAAGQPAVLPVAPAADLAPVGRRVASPTRAQIRAARRLQARKVGRLVRHVDLWSLLKVSLLFFVCMLCVGVIAGVLLWTALQRSGAVSSVEGFVQEVFLLDDFRFEGRDMFRIGVLGGMVGVLVLTLLTVLGGLLFNLISDLTGGVRVSVVELESARPAPPRAHRAAPRR